jgi:hypothetical protein
VLGPHRNDSGGGGVKHGVQDVGHGFKRGAKGDAAAEPASALARQRPDILAAEALLHQASAATGVARGRLDRPLWLPY